MKRRFALSRKVLIGGAAGLLLAGGGAGGAHMMGYLPGFGAGDQGLRGTLADDQHESTSATDGAQAAGAALPESGHGDKSQDDSGHGAGDFQADVSDAAHTAAGHDSHGDGVAQGHGDQEAVDHDAINASQLPDVVYEMPKPSPFNTTVRTLLRAQTLAAHGSSPAGASQRDIIAQLQKQLQSMDSATMTQRDLDFLGVYLLSGGDPRGLSGLIADIPTNRDMKKLLRGVRAHAIGDAENARKELADLDMRGYSAALGARLQLALAALAAPDDIEAQTLALKKAASLAPGTLTEEAALRRLLALTLKSGDRGGFAMTTSRYIRRFPTSLYIEDFISTFGQGVLQFESLKRPVAHDLIDQLYSKIPQDLSRRAALGLARKSVDSGFRELCLFLTETTLPKILDGGPEMNRVQLYALACSLVDSPAEALAQLSDLDVASLPPDDAELREDAMRMATAIMGQDLTADTDKFQGPQMPDSAVASSQVSATQQLQVSEELLKEARK